ncbi:hypothetical protein HUU40_02000, partial [candidate division KSB1 bacterium]|nr:hypothetical protein [candidate division KSB1 bacterium]
MKQFHQPLGLSILVCGLLCLASLGRGQDHVPQAKLPVLTTSAGQSADVNTLNVIMEQAEIKFDYCDVPTA